MTEVNPQQFRISASSVRAFKACPTLWRLVYREGVRPAADTDAQRVGTNWHAMHEVYANALAKFAADEMDTQEGADLEEYARSRVLEHLNQQYVDLPEYKTLAEWALEREVLLMSFIGYRWYWQADPVEFLFSELPFDLPLHNTIGLPLRTDEVMRVGKIDHIVKWQGAVCALERKSTTKSVAPDSEYWRKSEKDTQVSMYALAFQDLRDSGTLPDVVKAGAENERFGNTLYDVWHKPTIKPTTLTQKETAEFIASGVYCERAFVVEHTSEEVDGVAINAVKVNGESVEVEQGKKGFAVRETIEMFGARLLQDIYARPDFYYARREISRTDAEVRRFRGELYNIYQSMKSMAKTGFFFENEDQCHCNRKCDMIPICYGPGAAAVCDGRTTPAGFKRIFVDLTVNGHEVQE